VQSKDGLSRSKKVLNFALIPPNRLIKKSCLYNENMPASSSSPKRRRGGQTCNQNARKHGYYSSHYPASAQSEENPLSIDLQAEIDLIRASIQRLIALGEPQTYGEAVDYLRALSLATTALSRLVRTHRYVNPALDPRDELTRDIQQALKEVYATFVVGEPAKA
jgi:hypothetical protein